MVGHIFLNSGIKCLGSGKMNKAGQPEYFFSNTKKNLGSGGKLG